MYLTIAVKIGNSWHFQSSQISFQEQEPWNLDIAQNHNRAKLQMKQHATLASELIQKYQDLSQWWRLMRTLKMSFDYQLPQVWCRKWRNAISSNLWHDPECNRELRVSLVVLPTLPTWTRPSRRGFASQGELEALSVRSKIFLASTGPEKQHVNSKHHALIDVWADQGKASFCLRTKRALNMMQQLSLCGAQ